MKYLALFLVFLPLQLFATAQSPETLTYQGKTYAMFEEPLEQYFKAVGKRPDDRLRFVVTSNWRGYFGTWEIRDGKLLLVKLQQYDADKMRQLFEKGTKASFSSAYKDIHIGEIIVGMTAPVFAEWYSGTLKLPQGKVLQYVHMPYASLYEREILIEIDKGRVFKISEHDNSKDEKLLFSTWSDRQWVALSREPLPDPGDWVDARLLKDEEDKPTSLAKQFTKQRKIFKTRGTFFDYKGEKRLHIEGSVKTPMVDITVFQLPDGVKICHLDENCKTQDDSIIVVGDPVEVEGRFIFSAENGESGVQATAIRQLKPGETMHAADFPSQYALQNHRMRRGAKRIVRGDRNKGLE